MKMQDCKYWGSDGLCWKGNGYCICDKYEEKETMKRITPKDFYLDLPCSVVSIGKSLERKIK